ncbi:hypothetical protein [Frondihabitans australicus]|uniref:Uncharacterized protein n=1 Tax=Frondihabitans australicus TaxID=386892 RepID=A0A495IJD4_9MICO|nr:hypothetical protein [Frondihabitans australicus]RKR75899.1 hypothetical protein C8E83_3063 [Frondihabitans australicus]
MTTSDVPLDEDAAEPATTVAPGSTGTVEPSWSTALVMGGVLLVTTENGSRYELDFDRLCVTRYPDLETWPGARLRRDEDELTLRGLQAIIVGYPMRLLLEIREDGVPTVRQTGHVTSIEWLT